MPRALDTEAWADEMQIEALRKMGPARRMQLAFELSAAGWNLSRANIDELYPELSEDERTEMFIRATHGEEVASLYAKWRARKKA